jgi:hypothetical protein
VRRYRRAPKSFSQQLNLHAPNVALSLSNRRFIQKIETRIKTPANKSRASRYLRIPRTAAHDKAHARLENADAIYQY